MKLFDEAARSLSVLNGAIDSEGFDELQQSLRNGPLRWW
jgi:hypothetical protein